MSHPLFLRSLALAVVMLGTAGAAVGQQPASEKLGTVNFPVSCSPAAQAELARAVAALHSFWFDTARTAFEAVAAVDPSCGMPHWGTAMTLLGNPLANPPRPKALQDGWVAIEKARAAGARSERERGYIEAIALFYKDADTVDHRTRALAYEKAMEYRVRASAADALVKMPSSHVVPGMIEALRNADPGVRANAAVALGAFGPAAKHAVPAVARALKDPNLRVRELAGEALNRIVSLGPNQPTTLPLSCH